MRYQLALAALLLCVLVSACGRQSESLPPGSTPDAMRTPESSATLAPGDARFLLARRNVIERITLSGQQSGIVALKDNLRILDLALSPDGRQIAFVVELPAYTNDQGVLDFGADLYVSDAGGDNVRLVLAHAQTGDYFEAPSWLDDSTLLVGARGYSADRGSFNSIEQVDLRTGAHSQVLNDAAMGAVSPDRSSIVYTAIDPATRVQRLVVESLAADDAPRVLVDENDGLALFSAVRFSPDGAQLAFAAVDLLSAAPPPPPPGASPAYETITTTHPFAQDVWLIDPAGGSGPHRIAEIAENMPSLTWAADGKHLYALGPAFLWRLDVATGAAEQLRQSGEPGAIVWLEGG